MSVPEKPVEEQLRDAQAIVRAQRRRLRDAEESAQRSKRALDDAAAEEQLRVMRARRIIF